MIELSNLSNFVKNALKKLPAIELEELNELVRLDRLVEDGGIKTPANIMADTPIYFKGLKFFRPSLAYYLWLDDATRLLSFAHPDDIHACFDEDCLALYALYHHRNKDFNECLKDFDELYTAVNLFVSQLPTDWSIEDIHQLNELVFAGFPERIYTLKEVEEQAKNKKVDHQLSDAMEIAHALAKDEQTIEFWIYQASIQQMLWVSNLNIQNHDFEGKIQKGSPLEIAMKNRLNYRTNLFSKYLNQ